jgi:hypothetical protein
MTRTGSADRRSETATRTRIPGGMLCALLLIFTLGVASFAEDEPADTDTTWRDWFSGSLETGFEGAWSDENGDAALFQTLRLNVDPPTYENIHLRGALYSHADLDGDEPKSSALRDLNDPFGSDLRARLLYLYLDVEDLWGDSVLRVGRQRIQESPAYNRVDGVYFKQFSPRWDWYVFGGARASNYQDAHDDAVVGGGASARVSPWTRLAVDVFYEDDHRSSTVTRITPGVSELPLEYPRDIDGQEENYQAAFSLWQTITPNTRLFGRFTLTDDSGNEVLVDLTGYFEPADLTYTLTYRRLFNDVEDRVNDISYFYSVLGPYNEYDDVLLVVHKPLNDVWSVSVEGEIRAVHDNHTSSTDQDYVRLAGIVDAHELLPGIDTSIALEYWDVDERGDTWSVSGEATKRWEKVELTLGADYEAFEDRIVYPDGTPFLLPLGLNAPLPKSDDIDFVSVRTSEDVQSIYSKLKWRVKDDQEVALRVVYEQDDGPDSPYWRVLTTYTIDF